MFKLYPSFRSLYIHLYYTPISVFTLSLFSIYTHINSVFHLIACLNGIPCFNDAFITIRSICFLQNISWYSLTWLHFLKLVLVSFVYYMIIEGSIFLFDTILQFIKLWLNLLFCFTTIDGSRVTCRLAVLCCCFLWHIVNDLLWAISYESPQSPMYGWSQTVYVFPCMS